MERAFYDHAFEERPNFIVILKGLPHQRQRSPKPKKYGVATESFIKNGAYIWQDFTSFPYAYDCAAELFRTEEDFALLAYTYLSSLAAEGTIYSELFVA